MERRIRLSFWLGAGLAVILAVLGARHLGAQYATKLAVARGGAELSILADNLRSTVERFRPVPALMSTGSNIVELLRSPENPERVAAANLWLEEGAKRIGASAIYVMRADGLTIAASNWRENATFIGNNYAFRPYFRDAIASGSGKFYGVGVTTGQLGYFISSEVVDQGRQIGVIVLKIDLERFVPLLQRRTTPVYVADADRIVIIASDAALMYRPLRALDRQQIAQITANRRFASLDIGLPIDEADIGLGDAPVAINREMDIADSQWTITTFVDPEEVAATANFVGLVSGLGVVAAMLGISMIAMHRHHLRVERLAKRSLETRVEMRTLALNRTMQELSAEIAERKRIDHELHATRDELVQAVKLAAMGQALSGLAHEISQPVTALKAYLMSLTRMIESRDRGGIEENLLVMRKTLNHMAELTTSLHGFARKADSRSEPVDLTAVVQDVVALMKFRIGDCGARLTLALPSGFSITGDAARLRQVVLNLVMNAVDAVSAVEHREIRIDLSQRIHDGEEVAMLSVTDSGRGVPSEAVARLGEPFFTTKPMGRGLGLGLAISNTIVADHGGRLRHEPAPGGGAIFRIMLPVAGRKPQTQTTSEHQKIHDGTTEDREQRRAFG